MAITVGAPIFQTADEQVFSVTATADADTNTGVQTHLMGSKAFLTITPTTTNAATLGLWYQTTLSNTQWAIQKSTAANSGVAGEQLRVSIRRQR